MFVALTDDEDRARYESSLRDLRIEVDTIRNNAAAHQQKLALAHETLVGELSRADADLARSRECCSQLHADNARLANDNNDLMRVNQQLDDELLRLKARLFDLGDQKAILDSAKLIQTR